MTKSGKIIPVEILLEYVIIHDETYFMACLVDISEREIAQKQLTEQALTDELTGLGNRHSFKSNYQRIANKNQLGDILIALVDLDDFKKINDQHGHEIGDKLLWIVAQRLRNWVRKEDHVARIGGDEFVILMQRNALKREQINQLGTKLMSAISNPYWIDGLEINITASIGISTANHTMQPECLLNQADKAMYQAKKSGKNKFISHFLSNPS